MNIDPRTLPMGKEKFPAGMGDCLRGIESPYMDQQRIIREGHEAGQRAIESLFVWKIVAVMGWMAFMAVVVVARMR